MGILDKLKLKKTDKPSRLAGKKKEKKIVTTKKKDAAPLKQETVVTPEGKLATVAKQGEKKPTKAKPKKEDTGDAYRVLIRPLITEKGSALGMYNQYVFEVAPDTNKIEVRKAIKKVYGVSPIKINIINVRGKYVRYGRTEGMTKRWKKAIVTLPQGQKIEVQEGL